MVESIKELWKICYERQYVYRAWYNKYVSKVSIYVTWLLLHTPVTPNQVTIFEFFLVILGSIFLFLGKIEYIFIGMLIIQFTNLLDCVDGGIARYRKKSSLVGLHLEEVYHHLVSHLIFFPLAFGIFLQTGWKSVLIFGFICSIFSKSIIMPTMFSSIIMSRLSDNTPKHLKQNSKRSSNKINLQGSDIGKKLSDMYDRFKYLWAVPTNVNLTIISIIELINKNYSFVQNYALFYWFLVIYSIAVILMQVISFVVQYRGRAAENYYRRLFTNK